MKIPLSYSYRNLVTRRLTTALTAGGMALVVFVFAAVLMLAEGLRQTLVGTGSFDNAVVLRASAESVEPSAPPEKRWSMNSSTRASSTRTDTSMFSSNTPKPGPEDILIRITAANRGPDAAELHLLPTLWFRNDWSSWIRPIEPSYSEAEPQADPVVVGHKCCRGHASRAR